MMELKLEIKHIDDAIPEAAEPLIDELIEAFNYMNWGLLEKVMQDLAHHNVLAKIQVRE